MGILIFEISRSNQPILRYYKWDASHWLRNTDLNHSAYTSTTRSDIKKMSAFCRQSAIIKSIWFSTYQRFKCTIFWDITPCSPLKVNRRFGGTYRLHLQGRKISRAQNQRESRWQAKLRWKRLHAVISHRIELFITTAVRTSNPAQQLLFPQIILRGWPLKCTRSVFPLRYVPHTF
jgi:hypothetical protein